MKDKNSYKLIICAILVSVAVGSIAIVVVSRRNPVASLQKELLSMHSRITEDELHRKGYINTTNPLPEQNEEIQRFLHYSSINQKAYKICLRTYQIVDKELYVKIFWFDPDLNLIRSWTYLPWYEGASGFDIRYSGYYTVEDDGIVTVILKNVKNISFPAEQQIIIDESLYSYVDTKQ